MDNEILSKLETLGPVGLRLKAQLVEHYDSLNTKSDNNLKPEVVRMIDKSCMEYSIMIQLSHNIVSTGTSDGQNLTQLSIAVGERVRNYYNLPTKSASSLRLGIFILNAYAVLELVSIKLVNEFKQFNKAKTVYKIYSGYKRGELRKLVKEFNEISDPYKPLLQKASDWTSGTVKSRNNETLKLIKGANVDTLSKISPENTPIVLRSVNKKQSIAYTIKPKIFETYKWALNSKQECFESYRVETITKERKLAKELEAFQILRAAEPYVSKVFFQNYTLDRRGRCYPLAAFLTEIGSDNSKGMLTFAEGRPLGKGGLEELYHTVANHYGEDKLSHKDKVKFVENKYYEFVSMGKNPKISKGWMVTQSPFQFLSAVIELSLLDAHLVAGGKTEDFVSHIFNPRDGSCNGMQFILGLAKSDKHGHLVNLKPNADGKPGDLYSYIASKVRDKVMDDASNASEEAMQYYDLYFKTIERLRNRFRMAELNNDPRTEYKKKAIKHYQRKYKSELLKTDIIYWSKSKFSIREWRSIVKRGCMTYSYSATKRGLGEQIIEDTRDLDNKFLSNKQHSAARLLGSMVFDTIENALPEASDVMEFFKSNCEAYMKSTGKQYGHSNILTNFPFLQNYFKQKTVEVRLTDGLYVQGYDKKYSWISNVKFKVKSDLPIMNIAKSKSAVSPNTIHGLDSACLMLVIDACSFDIVTAHDSYASHCCNVEEMQKVIREKFKLIMDSNVLIDVLSKTGNLVPMIKQGQLDSSGILKSEFAFA